MNIEELYGQIGGDYAEVLGRLSSEALVSRFIVMFLRDESCSKLIAACSDGNDEEAFAAAHTAKGVCANLSLNSLSEQASQICEAYRPGNEGLRASMDIDELVQQFKADYEKAEAAISAFAAEQ